MVQQFHAPWYWHNECPELFRQNTLQRSSAQTNPRQRGEPWPHQNSYRLQEWEVADAIMNSLATQVAIGRIGGVDEVTGYVAFLLSDKSTFILGTELTIDGGMSQL